MILTNFYSISFSTILSQWFANYKYNSIYWNTVSRILYSRYGRRLPMFSSLFMVTLFGFIQSFSPNVAFFIVFRVIIGIFHGGMLVNAIVMSVELVGPKYRSFGGLIIWQFFTVAVCFLSLQSYYIQNWRKLSIITSAPYFVTVLGVMYVYLLLLYLVTGSPFFGLLFCVWFVNSGSALKHITTNTRMLKPLYLRFSWLMLMNVLWEKLIFQIINFWLRQSDLARTWAFQWGSLTCSTVEYYS